MMHLKNILSFILLSTLATTGSCKIRGSAAPTKQSDPAVDISDMATDLSKAPIFVTCKSANPSKTPIEMSIRQDSQSGTAQTNYRFGTEADVLAKGRWDNFDEPSSSQYLYSFGGLRFIITNDKAAGGFYPGTLVGTTQSDRYLEENLSCSKS
jgi:hypothetical protein